MILVLPCIEILPLQFAARAQIDRMFAFQRDLLAPGKYIRLTLKNANLILTCIEFV